MAIAANGAKLATFSDGLIGVSGVVAALEGV